MGAAISAAIVSFSHQMRRPSVVFYILLALVLFYFHGSFYAVIKAFLLPLALAAALAVAVRHLVFERFLLYPAPFRAAVLVLLIFINSITYNNYHLFALRCQFGMTLADTATELKARRSSSIPLRGLEASVWVFFQRSAVRHVVL